MIISTTYTNTHTGNKHTIDQNAQKFMVDFPTCRILYENSSAKTFLNSYGLTFDIPRLVCRLILSKFRFTSLHYSLTKFTILITLRKYVFILTVFELFKQGRSTIFKLLKNPDVREQHVVTMTARHSWKWLHPLLFCYLIVDCTEKNCWSFDNTYFHNSAST